MASIGKLFIAGKEKFEGKYLSGIAFDLSKPSTVDFIYHSLDGEWEIEFGVGLQKAIARSIKSFDLESLAARAFPILQEALDIFAVTNKFYAVHDIAHSEKICVYVQDGKFNLLVQSIMDHKMGIKMSIKSIDKNGVETGYNKETIPRWHQSFRYYRLAQVSTDLFDAYRNLYLGFENLLSFICKKGKHEKEIDWLRRSLNLARQYLGNIQAGTDVVEHIIKQQYIKIRCNLLHGKNFSSILPHARIDPIDVKTAYDELITIWNCIAKELFKFFVHNGVITYIGFEKMMEGVFLRDVRIEHTSDKNPPSESSTTLSDDKNTILAFTETAYCGSVSPGIVRLKAKTACLPESGNFILPVYKIGCMTQEVLYSITYLGYGLSVCGVDIFEYFLDLRLKNMSSPPTFS